MTIHSSVSMPNHSPGLGNSLDQKFRTYVERAGIYGPATKYYTKDGVEVNLDMPLQRLCTMLVEDYDILMNQLNTGERVIVPKNILHAKNMRKIAQDYLDQHGDDDPFTEHTIVSIK